MRSKQLMTLFEYLAIFTLMFWYLNMSTYANSPIQMII